MKIQTVTIIILQVTLIVTFISIFFFVYTSKVEHDIVVNQINSFVNGLTSDFNLVLDSSDKEALKKCFQSLTPENMDKQDADARQTNDELLKTTLIIIGIVFSVGMLTSIFFFVFYNVPVWQAMKESFFGLAMVALVEFTFLTVFVKNYKSLDPNEVKGIIVKTLQNYADS